MDVTKAARDEGKPMPRRHLVVLSTSAVAVLTGCPPATTLPPPPVCALSVVATVNSNVTQLNTGFKSGPIAGGTASGLAPALIQASFSEGLYDASHVTLPGPRVVRLLADELNGGPFPPSPPPARAHATTATGQWANSPGFFRGGVTRFNRVSATHLGGELRGCFIADIDTAGSAILGFPDPTSPTGVGSGDISLWGLAAPPGPIPPSGPPVPGAGNVGPMIDISCVGEEHGSTPTLPPRNLHVCGLEKNGWIFHTIFDGSRWTKWSNVQEQVGNHGPVEAVACAIEGRQLHLVASVRHSHGWFVEHTIRSPEGSWRPWQYVHQAPNGIPQGSPIPIRDVGAGFCAAEGPMPGGPPETQRLNIAWITDQSLSIVERSRGSVTWMPGFPPKQFSEPLSTWTIPTNVKLKTISIAQMPFPP